MLYLFLIDLKVEERCIPLIIFVENTYIEASAMCDEGKSYVHGEFEFMLTTLYKKCRLGTTAS